MSYIDRTDVEAEVPAVILRDALDDDRDGIEDEGLLDRLMELASGQVDALVATRYTVPFAQPPPFAREAARVFCAELSYTRRGVNPNPCSERATAWRKALAEIAAAETSASVGTARAPVAALTDSVLTEPLR